MSVRASGCSRTEQPAFPTPSFWQFFLARVSRERTPSPCRELLRDGFTSLARSDTEQLAKRGGIGMAKATRIVSAFEIARRVAKHEPGDPPHFDADVFSRGFIARSRSLRRSTSARCSSIRGAAFCGSAKSTSARPSTPLSPRATSSDLPRRQRRRRRPLPQSPSGDPAPSDEDLKYTKRMNDSLRLIDIQLVDHLIAGANGFTSLTRRGVIEDRKQRR